MARHGPGRNARAFPAMTRVAAMREPEREAGDAPARPCERTSTFVMQALLDCVDLEEIAALPPDEARRRIHALTAEIVQAAGVDASAFNPAGIAGEICDDLLGLGPLQPYLGRSDVTDILVNGMSGCFAEIGGRLMRLPVRFRSRDQIVSLCQRLAARAGRRVDEASPMCDARLPDGSRVNIVFPPLAVDGPVLTIRTFRNQPFTMAALTETGMFCARVRTLLEALVASRCNLLVTGGSGSGKTTLLGALTGAMGVGERAVICEDASELRPAHRHCVQLEARPRNLEGEGEVTIAMLVRNALRMRPDRIIVGEVRGAEAFDMLQAMNTGHDGSMATLHANDPEHALARIEAMAMMAPARPGAATVRGLIAGGIDAIVHLGRGADGSRRLLCISELHSSARGLHMRELVGIEDRRTGPWTYRFAGADAASHSRVMRKMFRSGFAPLSCTIEGEAK